MKITNAAAAEKSNVGKKVSLSNLETTRTSTGTEWLSLKAGLRIRRLIRKFLPDPDPTYPGYAM